MSRSVRPHVSAGSHAFYPSDPELLRREVATMLDYAASLPEALSPVHALISPHAGYVYSGQTAAKAYELVRGQTFERVVVIGPSHYAMFRGASIFDGEAYDTPLGLVPLDREFIARLRSESALFSFHPDAETREHSIEVQLPFLQQALGIFKLVPILIYDHGYANCMTLADALSQAMTHLGGSTLLVASSDLFHGPGASHCRQKSEEAAESISRGNAEEFCDSINSGDFMACGAGPIATVMIAAQQTGAGKPKVLDVTTSFEVHPRSEDYVVGYMAAAMFEKT